MSWAWTEEELDIFHPIAFYGVYSQANRIEFTRIVNGIGLK